MSRQQQELAEPLQVKPGRMGECAGCGKGILHGYLPVVTEWRPVQWSSTSQTLAIMVPKKIYCRGCGDQLVDGPRQHRRTRSEPIVMPQRSDEVEEELTAEQVMHKLYAVMSAETPMGSKKLAHLAGVEYSDIVLVILRALRKAGKVVFEDGRWRKAK